MHGTCLSVTLGLLAGGTLVLLLATLPLEAVCALILLGIILWAGIALMGGVKVLEAAYRWLFENETDQRVDEIQEIGRRARRQMERLTRDYLNTRR